MKKMMFSALACVAFAFSGFASNEVVGENDFQIEGTKPCEYYISITGPKGEIIDFIIFTGDLKQVPCADSFKSELEQVKRLYPTMEVEGEITSF